MKKPKNHPLFIAVTGGIVDSDGRIEVGDQIVQVNRNSFENLSDTEAVDLLRKAAASRRWAVLDFLHKLFYRSFVSEYHITDILFSRSFQTSHTLCC